MVPTADRSQTNCFAFPITVEPETLKIIDEVIMAGDIREQLVHFGGPVFPLDIVRICHRLDSEMSRTLWKKRILRRESCTHKVVSKFTYRKSRCNAALLAYNR